MSPNIQVQRAAQRDLDEIADYLAVRSLPTALRFSQEVAAAFARLAAMPDLGSLCEFAHPALAKLRIGRIRRFPKYLIFYLPQKNGIEVLRVLHASRDLEKLLEKEDE